LSDELARLEAVAGPVSRETWRRLQAYHAALKRWTAKSNLVAPSTLAEFWERHRVASAQLLPLKPEARRWLDLGSGGGLPGIVIAAFLADRPSSHVWLVESNGKKAAFLNAVIAELGLPAHVCMCRIEEAHDRVGPADVVTARALAPLPLLLRLAQPWLAEGAAGLFHKGRDFVGELAKAHDEWRFDLIEHKSVVESAGRILEIGNLRSRDEARLNQSGTSQG
jgi:16S rRNA (guanine527-N7)-methyltransferase